MSQTTFHMQNLAWVRPGLIGLMFGLTLLLCACSDIEGEPFIPDAATDTGDGVSDDAGIDTGTDASVDIGDSDSGVDMGECDTAADCTAGMNASATCEGGACLFACEGDFVDVDGDLAMGGDCECVEPQMCAGAMGVCADARKACDAFVLDPTCGETEFEALADYTADDEEAWTCDMLDNDCDGTADEACCADAASRIIESFGSGTPQLPAITAALPTAPAGAVHLLVWVEGNDVKLQHIDGFGAAVGAPGSETLAGETITSLDVIEDGTQYEVFVTTEITGVFGTRSRAFDASLTAGANEVLHVGGESQNIRAATTASHTCATWSVDATPPATGHDVVMTCYAHGMAASAPVPTTLTDATTRTTQAARPVIADVAGDDVVVAWWDNQTATPADAAVELRRQDPMNVTTGGVASERMITARETAASERIGLSSAADAAWLVHLDYDSTNLERRLALTPYGLANNQFSQSQIIVDTNDPEDPAALVFDLDGDGVGDRFFVSWVAGGDLLAVSFSEDGGARRTLQTGAPSGASLTSNGFRAGAIWLQGGGTDAVQFTPINRFGDFICTP